MEWGMISDMALNPKAFPGVHYEQPATKNQPQNDAPHSNEFLQTISL
jgi:hypothetical protein